MQVRHIGIITNSATSQGNVNDDHAEDIARALEGLGYQTVIYNVTNQSGIEQMVTDRRTGRLDLVFNNSAGRHGGDGSVEGLLEIFGIPYAGSDVLATAVAFDKRVTKFVVSALGVPIVPSFNFTREQYEKKHDWVLEKIERGRQYPVVVKASRGSDSIGVSFVESTKQLPAALKAAFHEDDQVIVEDFVRREAEITCMVIGNGLEARAFKPVERVFEGKIYNISLPGRTYRIPTHLDRETIRAIERHSLTAHRALGCDDYSRSDFIVSKSGQIYFLELNAHAGLGNVGPTAFTAQHTEGWDHQRLIGAIVHAAVTRHKSQTRVRGSA